MKPEDEVRAADAGFLIEAVRERRTYEGLRSLWCRTFGDEAHPNTWKKWKKRFITRLAYELGLV